MADAAQHATRARPVLMIGVDAAEITLVERWMAEGILPQLRALCERSTCVRLGSTAQWLVGSPWPSFYTGTTPADHGLYHYLQWRPERMIAARPAPDWLPLQPFWRDIAAHRRVVAIDIPLTYAPGAFGGVEVCGWASHEALQPPCSTPAPLLSQIVEEFGAPPLGNEQARLLRASELLAIRDQCIRSAGMVASLAVELMRRQPWDLFMVCLAATHRGGHQLWNDSNMAGPATPQQARQLGEALQRVYAACDEAVGRLVRQAGESTTVMLFSLHRMGANVSRADLLGEMLVRILGNRKQARSDSPGRELLDRLRALAPGRLRSWVKRRLPYAWQDRLTQVWRTGRIDWRSTRAFAPLSDLDGYVRVNLRGRESAGIVAPGAEYEALCAQISDGLATFVDADTGAPLVQAIARPDDLYATGAMKSYLPDLMVRWADTPAAAHRNIVSPRYGSIAWPTPGRHPQGRSGNHRPNGFLIAAGDLVAAGPAVSDPHILDLAPSVYALLGLPVPPQMHGRPLFPQAGS
jgi:predicted AlkP superfamily phosphohydrolase/phosphomutase